ncbi:hypothetical protein IM988_002659 [Escherichia coli]|nr:hypothetical protein [Escherichia coli]EHK6278771.1 hypothetical protein [Escherichia coli]EHK6340152.1 hypothetical protein [Escherichia coli]MBA8019685.1 hypothetical protein [Escherichia coli]MBL9252318.1 hypothetical protein [Escherichia coli]MBS8731204.1 hypothetical protein [Escherichia coli]
MKQMALIEMDGFLKGKCIPSDLKVNETNAEYLVRKFAELESKLETALRECRSAGITIDNLEAKCAALAAKINVINELMEVAEQVNKLAQEETEKLAHERNTLAAENAGLKSAHPQPFGHEMMKALDAYEKHQDEVPETGMLNAFFILRDSIRVDTPAADAFLAEVRAKAFDDLCVAFVKHASVSGLDDGDCVTVKEATDALLHCAEQLHKGVHS